MFHSDDDTLRRMEEALLAEEEISDEQEVEEEPDFEEEPDLGPEDEDPFPIRNYANHYRAYTNQSSDVNFEEYSREIREPRQKKDRTNLYLALLALILTACIAMVAIWFLLRMGLL